jgi:hypothetical protein
VLRAKRGQTVAEVPLSCLLSLGKVQTVERLGRALVTEFAPRLRERLVRRRGECPGGHSRLGACVLSVEMIG